jgi:hypothetical protein
LRRPIVAVTVPAWLGRLARVHRHGDGTIGGDWCTHDLAVGDDWHANVVECRFVAVFRLAVVVRIDEPRVGLALPQIETDELA